MVGAGPAAGEVAASTEQEPGPARDDVHREITPITIASRPLEFVRRWNRIGRTWLLDGYARLTGGSRCFEDALHRFASWLETEDRPAEIEKELLLLVGRMLPASRSELIPPIDDANSCRDKNPAQPGNTGYQKAPNPNFWVEEVPIKWGRAEFGRLRVTGDGRNRPAYRRQWASRLNTICALAACALKSLRPGQECPGEGAAGPLVNTCSDSNGTVGAGESDCGVYYPKMLHDATFLNAILPFAISQAQRHREPLSLVCVAIDRLSGIQELLGRAVADSLVRCVGEMVVSLIRSSDIVARLDDDRVVAVLPRSGGEGALHVGEMICEKVAERRWLLSDRPGVKITVSVGAATFPSSADNVFSLFEAADDALAQAQAHGRNQAAQAPRILVAPPNEAVVAPGGV